MFESTTPAIKDTKFLFSIYQDQSQEGASEFSVPWMSNLTPFISEPLKNKLYSGFSFKDFMSFKIWRVFWVFNIFRLDFNFTSLNTISWQTFLESDFVFIIKLLHIKQWALSAFHGFLIVRGLQRFSDSTNPKLNKLKSNTEGRQVNFSFFK